MRTRSQSALSERTGANTRPTSTAANTTAHSAAAVAPTSNTTTTITKTSTNNNNVKRVISLDEATNLDALSVALRDPHCVVIYLSLYESFMKKHSRASILAFFSRARLPNLLGLKIDRPESHQRETTAMREHHLQRHQQRQPPPPLPFPVKALYYLIQCSHKMEYLIFDLKLAGTRQEYRLFGELVQELTDLQCIGATMSVEEQDTTMPPSATRINNNNRQDDEDQEQEEEPNLLDPLIHSLSKLTKLTDIIIKGHVSNLLEGCLGPLQSSSLENLCRLPRLTSIYLFLFILSDDNVVAMAQALEHNKLVREFWVNCRLGLRGSQAYSRMLRLNTSLEELILFVYKYHPLSNNNNNNNNNNISSNDGPEDPASLVVQEQVDAEIANGLAESKSVQEFLYQGVSQVISTRCHTLFRNAVKTNYIIEKLSLRVGPADTDRALQNEIKFYLQLNNHKNEGGGRATLLRDTTALRDVHWVDKLATVNSQVPTLFYYLTADPSLCILPRQDEPNNTTSRRGRRRMTTTNNSQSSSSRSGESFLGKRKRLYRAAKYKGVCYT